MAQDLNHVAVIGHLTRDLENEKFGYTSGGMAVANISIAVNRSKKSGDQWTEEVSYFDVTIFGKAAENLKPYLVECRVGSVNGDMHDIDLLVHLLFRVLVHPLVCVSPKEREPTAFLRVECVE